MTKKKKETHKLTIETAEELYKELKELRKKAITIGKTRLSKDDNRYYLEDIINAILLSMLEVDNLIADLLLEKYKKGRK